jgi:hypothetical protein
MGNEYKEPTTTRRSQSGQQVPTVVIDGEQIEPEQEQQTSNSPRLLEKFSPEGSGSWKEEIEPDRRKIHTLAITCSKDEKKTTQITGYVLKTLTPFVRALFHDIVGSNKFHRGLPFIRSLKHTLGKGFPDQLRETLKEVIDRTSLLSSIQLKVLNKFYNYRIRKEESFLDMCYERVSAEVYLNIARAIKSYQARARSLEKIAQVVPLHYVQSYEIPTLTTMYIPSLSYYQEIVFNQDLNIKDNPSKQSELIAADFGFFLKIKKKLERESSQL